MYPTWSEEEERILIENYSTTTNEDMQKLIPNKSWIGIYKKAYRLGLKRDCETKFKNRSISQKGCKTSRWKGGVKINKQGYRLIYKPEHNRANNSGYVLEHIVVFEDSTQITIPPNCCIHHLNGIKDDNRIENLCMMTHAGHTIFHHTGSKRSNETRQKISERKKNL